jgi:hypothetical protein
LPRLAQPVVIHRDHAGFGRRLLNLLRRRALMHQHPQRVGERQEFEHRDTAEIAAAEAVLAALCAVEQGLIHRRIKTDLARQCRQHAIGLAAMWAELAHQPLRQHAVHRRGHEIILDTHIEEPRHRRGGAVGMQGREHEMARERGLHRDLRRLKIAHFADHDDVGVLAQDRAQHMREGQADLRFHLDLVDAFELIFDRIFDGEELALGQIEPVETGIERRRLAAAGRTGHQQDALRPV